MELKCVKCEEDAQFLVEGTSYCKEHLPKGYRPTHVNDETMRVPMGPPLKH
jgi:hypothetical protein